MELVLSVCWYVCPYFLRHSHENDKFYVGKCLKKYTINLSPKPLGNSVKKFWKAQDLH